MSLEVRIEFGMEPLKRFASDFPNLLRSAMRGALGAIGRDMVGKAKQEAPADTGDLRRGMDSAILETDDAVSVVVFNRFKHSIFVHGGAKFPGKMPPAKALLGWARRHLTNRKIAHKRAQYAAGGLDLKVDARKLSGAYVGKDEALAFAWAVARGIKKRGFIAPRPFLRDAFNARKQNAENLIRLALKDAMGQSVSD